MKIYLSGPISGICDADGKPNGNFPAFNDAAKQLRDLGHDVVNPAELSPIDSSWADRVEITIPLMVKCGAVVVLPGYSQCKESILEIHIARKLDITVCSVDTVIILTALETSEWAKPKDDPVGHP